jgi:hypothetical protein
MGISDLLYTKKGKNELRKQQKIDLLKFRNPDFNVING